MTNGGGPEHGKGQKKAKGKRPAAAAPKTASEVRKTALRGKAKG